MEELKTLKEIDIDWENNCFLKKDGKYQYVYGIDALKIWIKKALHKECKRLRFEGLGKNYGHDIESIIGQPLSVSTVSLIESGVKECLCANPYIENVSMTDYEIKESQLKIYFSVKTVYTTLEIKEVFEI